MVRERSGRRRRVALSLGLLLGLVLTAEAGAQTPPDLHQHVAGWASGRFASPVMCELQGELVRGIRRVILRPKATMGRPVRILVQFVDMRPDGATRCVNAMGTPQPNLLGKVELQLPNTSHPETAVRDFKRALKRERGFDLDIATGVLKVQRVADPLPEAEIVDFRGGEARLGLVLPATDPARELAEFDSPRKLLLILQSREGERIELPLFLASEDPV